MKKRYKNKNPEKEDSFPDELLNAFQALETNNWDEKSHNKYNELAEQYLSSKDSLDLGELVVRLTRFCLKNNIIAGRSNSVDIDASVVKKFICQEHKNYRGLRKPRTGCKDCWKIDLPCRMKKWRLQETHRTVCRTFPVE